MTVGEIAKSCFLRVVQRWQTASYHSKTPRKNTLLTRRPTLHGTHHRHRQHLPSLPFPPSPLSPILRWAPGPIFSFQKILNEPPGSDFFQRPASGRKLSPKNEGARLKKKRCIFAMCNFRSRSKFMKNTGFEKCIVGRSIGCFI